MRKIVMVLLLVLLPAKGFAETSWGILASFGLKNINLYEGFLFNDYLMQAVELEFFAEGESFKARCIPYYTWSRKVDQYTEGGALLDFKFRPGGAVSGGMETLVVWWGRGIKGGFALIFNPHLRIDAGLLFVKLSYIRSLILVARNYPAGRESLNGWCGILAIGKEIGKFEVSSQILYNHRMFGDPVSFLGFTKASLKFGLYRGLRAKVFLGWAYWPGTINKFMVGGNLVFGIR